MPRALFADTVIAESDDTVLVEGNHYFPADALKREYVEPSGNTSVPVEGHRGLPRRRRRR